VKIIKEDIKKINYSQFFHFKNGFQIFSNVNNLVRGNVDLYIGRPVQMSINELIPNNFWNKK